MTRYWLPIVVLVLIISSVGTYYIRGPASHLPEYALVPQQGDAEEAKGVFVRGLYSQTRYSPSVVIDLDGSEYASEQSFFEKLDPYNGYDEEIGQLVEEHRSFMRGKRDVQSIYQDDQLLVYAGLEEERVQGKWEYQFEISMLEKQEQETATYDVQVPDLSGYLYPYIQDVQVYGDELVIIMSARNSDTDEMEYRRYSLDLTNGDVLADEALPFPVEEGDRVRRVVESVWTQADRYNVFYSIAEDGDGTVYTQLMRYDLTSGKMDVLQAPAIDEFLEGQSSENGKFPQVDGDRLYMTEYGQQSVRVLEYDLSSDQGILHQIEVAGAIHSQIVNDRIYLLVQEEQASSASLLVADLPGGEVLFEGAIEAKGTEADKAEAMQKLELGEVSVSGS